MNPLTQLSLAELRRRTSVKWRQYADDVLPLWVAEMDVPLAAPVAEALHDAVGRGDTGYACGTHYAEALGDFAARRWGWSDLPVDRTTLVPDVMLGIVEVLRLLTGPGDAVVVCAPVYPPFYAFVSHADRRVIEAPLGADQRMDTSTLEEAFRRAARTVAGRCSYCATRTTRRAWCTAATNSKPSPTSPAGTGCGWSPTRSTPRWCCRGRGSRRT